MFWAAVVEKIQPCDPRTRLKVLRSCEPLLHDDDENYKQEHAVDCIVVKVAKCGTGGERKRIMLERSTNDIVSFWS